ncbi:MAG: pitrilysin family protein [Planctomycetota bacterium]
MSTTHVLADSFASRSLRSLFALLFALPIWSSYLMSIDAASPQDAPAQAGEASDTSVPDPITQIEGISEYALKNGTRILLFPDNSKEVVTVNMTVFVGSRHEGYGEAGMAHLLEHMLFKGTPSHPNVPKVLQDRGARFNGTTWMDRTNYYETLPASEDNLKFALELESDRLVNSFVRGEDLESEMTVVRNEFERGENSPIRVLMQRMQSTAYDWHNYGKSTIGNRSDIERVPIVNLRRFYRKFYRPDNVMVIVAGKFDPQRALELIDETFGQLKTPETPIDPTYTVEPPKDGERTVVLRRVGEIQLAGAAYHIPAGGHPDYAAAKALVYVLGDEPSGRLYKGMVETEIASNVYTLSNAFSEPGIFMALAEVSEDDSIETARSTLIDLMERDWEENPVTEAEVERAKQQILKQRELQANNTDQLAVALSDWAAQGDWRLYFLFRDAVEALTQETVQAFAKKFFVRNNRTVGLFIPSEEAERVSIPETPDLIARLKDYKGREQVQQGEAFDPDPQAIEERILRGDLVGGIEYAMVPKKTRGEAVSLMLTLRFGTPETLKDRVGAVELLGILMQRGTEKLTYQELQDELTRLRADLSMNSTIGLLTMQVKTKRDSLPEVIDLLGDIAKTPRLDAEELEVLRRQIITGLEQSTSEPNSLAPRLVRRKLSPYGKEDIRYVQTIEEEIEMYSEVAARYIQEVHGRFLGNQAGEFTIVGDFDPEQIKTLMANEFDGWTSDEAYVRVDRPANTNADAGVEAIETPDKANALLYSGMQFDIDDQSPEYASLVLGNFILGGGSLSSRLGDRVRQQEGLSYGVRSGVSSRVKDHRADFTLYAITNPANKDKLLTVIREEVDRLREEGVTEDELERAKESYLQSRRVSRTGDATLANLLVELAFNDRTMKSVQTHEQNIRDATVEGVNAAIRKYIDMDKLVMAVAGDFANNPPE